jgi:hypothetical protein
MRRHVVTLVFVAGALVALMNATPIHSVAQVASPSAGTSELGPEPAQELCTAAEIEKGNTGIVVEPPGEAAVVTAAEVGGVTAAETPHHLLWVVAITVPPQSCRAFQSPEFPPQRGPIVLFVQSGSIEYGVHSASTPPATVVMGHQDDSPQPVPPDLFVPLSSGDWVTQDRAAWFTYRNPGPGSALVLMAALVVESDEECSGGCRGKG